MPIYDLKCPRCGYKVPDVLVMPADLKKTKTCPICCKAKLEKMPVVAHMHGRRKGMIDK